MIEYITNIYLHIAGFIGFRGEQHFGNGQPNASGYYVFYPYKGFNDPWRIYEDEPIFYADVVFYPELNKYLPLGLKYRWCSDTDIYYSANSPKPSKISVK